MKITAKCKSDIRYFAKVNNLNINNNQELQEYLNEVGFKAFMCGLFIAALHKREEIGFYFSPDNQKELTQLEQLFAII